jgi:hypothetical protein
MSGTRASIILAVALAGCAMAGKPEPGGDDPGLMGTIDASVPPPPDACPDLDLDTRCDVDDVCPGFDDRVDSDGDTVPDGCDICAGADDRVDSDADTVPDGCDRCPGADDRIDVNENGVPDACDVQTIVVDLKKVGSNLWRGWHSSSGGHTSANDNTLTGLYNGATYNSYFVFTLAGFSPSTIQSVTLELQLESYSGDGSETLSIWDVTTPASTVENTETNNVIFNDLQSGVRYATLTVTNAQLNSIVAIPLNAQAVADVTSKLGQDFVVGVHVDTPPGWVRFGHTGSDAAPTVNRLRIQYLP